MKRLLMCVAVVLSVAIVRPTVMAIQWAPPSGSPLANREHPRLWLTNSTLPAIRARVSSGGAVHAEFKTWVALMDSVFATAASAPPGDLHLYAMNFGFLYRIGSIPGVSAAHTPAEYASVGKAAMLALARQASALGNVGTFGIPIAYDWLHDQLTPAERQTMVTFMKTAESPLSARTGQNPFNCQVVAARQMVVLSGLAFAGDGIDDAAAASMYGAYPTFFHGPTGALDTENWWAGTDGGAGQGYSYTASCTFGAMLNVMEGWRTANGLSKSAVYQEANYLKYYPQLVAYMLLPHSVPSSAHPTGRRYSLWKTYAANANQTLAQYADNFTYLPALAGIYESVAPNTAALAQWLVENRLGQTPATGTLGLRSAVMGIFLNGTKTVTARSPSALQLPLSRNFQSGWVPMRTGWDSENDTLVTFSASPFFRSSPGYSNMNPGSFTIDRKGPQVIHQGNSIHDWANGSTYASNTLVFPDRTIAPPDHPFADRGGHRFWYPDVTGYGAMVKGSPWDEREDMRFLGAAPASGRDVDYVAADLTRAYSSSRSPDPYNAPKISSFVRDLVYFRPTQPGAGSDIVVVFDRASTLDTKFEKAWLLHTAGEPIVDGAGVAGQPVRNGSGAGKWTYTGANLITATNVMNGSNGKTFVRMLLPAQRRVIKVGGPNASGQSFVADSHEFEDAYGRQGPVQGPPDAPTAQYVGSYRIEVIPAVAKLDDVFLNVIEVTDAGVATPTAAVLLPAGGMVAARIGTNRIAAFNSVAGDLTAGQFSIDQSGTYRIHVANLVRGGEYDVIYGGRTVRMQASVEAGTLYFDAAVAAGAAVSFRDTGGRALIPEILPAAPGAPTRVRIIR